MRRALRQFAAGDIDLHGLICGLQALLNVLEEAPADWRHAFQDEWCNLEVTYAVAMDCGGKSLSPEDVAGVQKAVARLAALLAMASVEPGADDAG